MQKFRIMKGVLWSKSWGQRLMQKLLKVGSLDASPSFWSACTVEDEGKIGWAKSWRWVVCSSLQPIMPLRKLQCLLSGTSGGACRFRCLWDDWRGQCHRLVHFFLAFVAIKRALTRRRRRKNPYFLVSVGGDDKKSGRGAAHLVGWSTECNRWSMDGCFAYAGFMETTNRSSECDDDRKETQRFWNNQSSVSVARMFVRLDGGLPFCCCDKEAKREKVASTVGRKPGRDLIVCGHICGPGS